MYTEKRFEKPEKLSELLQKDERKFAEKVMAMVDENHKEYKTYRDKCFRNERVWRNRHWDENIERTEEDIAKAKPNSPTLHSMTENIVSDVVDNIPDQIIRGVNYDDDIKAIIATELVRFILQRAKFPQKFEKKARKSIKVGVGTLQAFWNPDIANGMGDIDFRLLHIDNITWDKSVEDINDGKFFAIDFWLSHEAICDMYPDLDLNEAEAEDETKKETHINETENIRVSNKEHLIRMTLFMWKEKEPRTVQTDDGEEQLGHKTFISSAVVIGKAVPEQHIKQYEYDRYMVGMLPHVEIDGEPIGLSAIDLFQDDADVINFIEQQYLCNLQESSVPRFLVNRTAGINEKDLLNYDKRIIHGNQIHEGAVREFIPTPFSSQPLNYRSGKIQEIKENSGQTDFNIGQVAGGVTSGYGIERMQVYGQKRSRLITRHFYWDHEYMIKDVLKLAQQHYNTERVIRLTREAQDQIEKLLQTAMENIQSMEQQLQEQTGRAMTKEEKNQLMKSALPEGVSFKGNELTVDFSIFSLDYIDLDYDIEIIPQKKNAATSAAMNEMVQMMVNAKAIDGELAIELYEFEGKDKIVKKIRERNDINKQMQQMAQQTQQLMEQLKQTMAQNNTLTKENEQLEQQYWAEKFKELRLELLNQNSGEEQGEKLPETAEQAISNVEALINDGISRRQQA